MQGVYLCKYRMRVNITVKEGGIMGKAATKAKNKYNAENYERISLSVEKGQKDIIKAHAERKGESLNGFINRAINETMEREKEG